MNIFMHTIQAGTPYVCIEPWCSLGSIQDVPAIFEERKDLLRIAPGEICKNLRSMHREF